MLIYLNMARFSELLPSLRWALNQQLLSMDEITTLIGELITTFDIDPATTA